MQIEIRKQLKSLQVSNTDIKPTEEQERTIYVIPIYQSGDKTSLHGTVSS